MFQYPGVFVEQEDSVEAGGEGGIDVAFGAVADHPTGVRGEFVARDHCLVSRRIFFGDDFDCREVRGESGAREFVGLFGVVAFRHEDQAMARGETATGSRRRREASSISCSAMLFAKPTTRRRFSSVIGSGLSRSKHAINERVKLGSP